MKYPTSSSCSRTPMEHLELLSNVIKFQSVTNTHGHKSVGRSRTLVFFSLQERRQCAETRQRSERSPRTWDGARHVSSFTSDIIQAATSELRIVSSSLQRRRHARDHHPTVSGTSNGDLANLFCVFSRSSITDLSASDWNMVTSF